MKKAMTLLLAAILLLSLCAAPAAAEEDACTGWGEIGEAVEPAGTPETRDTLDLSEEAVRDRIMAMQSTYPDDTPWSNDNTYKTAGKLYDYVPFTGHGCVALALILSDAAFGNLPIYSSRTFRFEDLRVGDILRVIGSKGTEHSVIIIEKRADSVVVAEGNFNSSVHWGRVFTKSEVMEALYIMSRYPDALHKFGTQLVDGKTYSSKSSDFNSANFYRFVAADSCWSAIFSFSTDVEMFYYTPNGRLAGSVNLSKCSSAWIKDNLPATTPGKEMVLMFMNSAYDDSTKISVNLSNGDPNKLPTQFLDVHAGQFYVEPVKWAVQKGITSGTDKYHFSPSDACTRGQVVTFLWRAAGEPNPQSGENPFADVKSGDFYYNAVLWAAESGITSGTSATAFSPKSTCTRGQIVTFLWRYKGKPAPEASGTSGVSFSDVQESGYYYEAVIWAVSKGITNGTGGGKFSPNDKCTRGQVVTFLYRATPSA